MLLSLLNKVSRTQSQLRIRRAETLVACLHGWWDIRCFAHLISSHETTIEDLID